MAARDFFDAVGSRILFDLLFMLFVMLVGDVSLFCDFL